MGCGLNWRGASWRPVLWGLFLFGVWGQPRLEAQALPSNLLTWLWANPPPHGNNLVDFVYQDGWGVQVAELGQLYTSLGLAFWTRRETGTTAALRSATFFGRRLVVTGEQGTVLYADSPTNQFQLIHLGTTDWLEGVAASPTLLVAVGDHAAIYTSNNGTNWTRQVPSFSNWLRSVAYGNGLFVVAGESGLIATSSNGQTWTTRNSQTTLNLNKALWTMDRFWVVGEAGAVLTSANGVQWSRQESGAVNDLYGMAGSSLHCLVFGDEEMRLARRFSSGSQTVIWNNQLESSAGTAPTWTYYSGFWDGVSYWVGGQTGFMVQGIVTNLITGQISWTEDRASTRVWLWDIVKRSDLFATVGEQGAILTSLNGATWNLESVPTNAVNDVLLGINTGPHGLVAAGTRGLLLFSPDLTTNVLVTNVIDSQMVVTNRTVSLAGILWQAIEPRLTTNDLQGVVWFTDRWWVTGGNGIMLTSPDGTNWQQQAAFDFPMPHFLSSAATFPGGVVVTGDQGTLLTSGDGVTWRQVEAGTTNWLYRVRFGNGWLMAVGENGTILTSTNGVDWSHRASGTTNWLNDAAWFDNTFCAAGLRGTVLASTNLVDWTPLTCVTRKPLFGLAPDQHQLVAVGTEGIILRAQRSPVLIMDYDRRASTNRFLFSGLPGTVFALEQSPDLSRWIARTSLQFLDPSGLLYYQYADTNSPPQSFYRGHLEP